MCMYCRCCRRSEASEVKKKQNATDAGLIRPTALLPAEGCRTAHDQESTAAILAGLLLDFGQQF